MLDDFGKGILKANRIEESDVEDVDSTGMITFKDGSQRQICECWTRVMGYLRPFSEFNIGKKSEFRERKYFTEEKCNCNQDDELMIAAE